MNRLFEAYCTVLFAGLCIQFLCGHVIVPDLDMDCYYQEGDLIIGYIKRLMTMDTGMFDSFLLLFLLLLLLHFANNLLTDQYKLCFVLIL